MSADDSPRVSPGPVPSYLGWTVAATVLCFLPLGVVALYGSWRTQTAVEAGDEGAARMWSRRTRGWLIATVVVGLGLWLLLGGATVMLGAFSS